MEKAKPEYVRRRENTCVNNKHIGCLDVQLIAGAQGHAVSGMNFGIQRFQITIHWAPCGPGAADQEPNRGWLAAVSRHWDMAAKYVINGVTAAPDEGAVVIPRFRS